MKRRKWLWTTLLALPLVIAGMVYANWQPSTYICPVTGDPLPCPDCCPLVQNKHQAPAQSYLCPITGERLPCEQCCPLRESQ